MATRRWGFRVSLQHIFLRPRNLIWCNAQIYLQEKTRYKYIQSLIKPTAFFKNPSDIEGELADIGCVLLQKKMKGKEQTWVHSWMPIQNNFPSIGFELLPNIPRRCLLSECLAVIQNLWRENYFEWAFVNGPKSGNKYLHLTRQP